MYKIKKKKKKKKKRNVSPLKKKKKKWLRFTLFNYCLTGLDCSIGVVMLLYSIV